jgi:hypothetical protein
MVTVTQPHNGTATCACLATVVAIGLVRSKMPKKPYGDMPKAPKSKVALGTLTDTSKIAGKLPSIVPQPKEYGGFLMSDRKITKAPLKNIHGLMRVQQPRTDNFRLSGHPKAHRIGKK